jgi:alcohol dehydrogenase
MGMRAAVLTEYGEPLSIESVERPEPDLDGIVVEVDACGICRSDWHAWQGHGEWADDQAPLGQVLGHEPAGEVVEVGSRVERITEGDRVTVPFNLGDGTCRECLNGHGNVCPEGLALGFEPDAPGAFAEYVHVPAAEYNAVPLPDGVSAVETAALGCRYVTAFHALRHRAGLEAGEWLVVIGCGGVGLSAIQIADAFGANVVAVDISDEKLERATEVGATATVNPTELGNGAEEGVPAAVRAATGGGAHVSMDALGREETCWQATESLRRRGRHVQVGLTGSDERGSISLPTDEMCHREIDFHGVRGMPPTRYEEILPLVERGRLDPGRLVTREVALEDVADRLAAMTDYETVGIEVVTDF